MVDKSRDNSLFQETSYFEYCSESRKFLIFSEKVSTFKSLRFCGIDFQRSIALNEIICLPMFVLTCGLYKFFCGCISSIVAMHFASILEGVAKYIR